MEIAQAVKEVFEGAVMLHLYPRCATVGTVQRTVRGTVQRTVLETVYTVMRARLGDFPLLQKQCTLRRPDEDVQTWFLRS